MSTWPPKPTVDSKREFYERSERLEFGNRLPMWRDPLLALQEWDGEFGLRSTDPAGRCLYHVPWSELEETFASYPKGECVISVMTKDEWRVFQGEVIWGYPADPVVSLHYSLAACPMRPALRDHGQHARGVRALELMRHFMSPSSYEDLQALREHYPDAVVEFSTFEFSLGVIPGRNTVIWEVRNY